MLQNIKISIYQFEAEDIRKFTADIKKLSAAEIKRRYSNDLTQKTAEALTEAGEGMPDAKTLEKIIKKHTRRAKKATAERLQKLAEVEAAELPQVINISVEWHRSSVWGYNPAAEISAERCRTYGKASGCGYDKESAAVASALNAIPEALKIIYKYVDEGGALPYGARVWAGLPSFAGGAGIGCYRLIFEACGYEWRQVGSGKLFNCYTIERRDGNA